MQIYVNQIICYNSSKTFMNVIICNKKIFINAYGKYSSLFIRIILNYYHDRFLEEFNFKKIIY